MDPGDTHSKYMPVVDHCCWCVPNLRVATILIGVIAMISSLDAVLHPGFKSYCSKFKDSPGGGFIMFWYGIQYILLLFYTASIGILLYSTIRKDPSVKVFIYLQLVIVAWNLILAVLHHMRYNSMDPNNRCFKVKEGVETGKWDIINYTFWAIVGALFGYYCCIVVNSYSLIAQSRRPV